jgi:hypothetical protein
MLPLLASRATSQTEPPSDDAPPLPSRTHTLSGTVVNSVSGDPVRRAMVQVAVANSASEISTLTDSEGRFEFSALPESDITVLVHKPGYFSGLELNPSNFEPEVVHLSTDVANLALPLLPESVIAGHVATAKGEPIEDSPVRILREVVSNGYRHWEVRGQATTDEEGQFRVVDLMPGRYLLATGPNVPSVRVTSTRGPRKDGYETVFYPGVTEMESATPLVIAGGQQLQADFALKPEPVFQVAGTLVGFSPGSGIDVQFATKSGEIIPSPIEVNNQTGNFHGAVPGGAYILQARGSDSAGRLAAADLPVVVNNDVEGITLALGSSITVPVNVDLRPTSRLPEQVAAANFRTARDFAVSTIRMFSADQRVDNVEVQAERNERGALAFRNLVAGRYFLEVSTTQPWYVRSATSGTTDLLRDALVVGAGRRLEPLELVLGDDGASLKVQVLADEQPAGGSVLLFSDQTILANARTGSSAPGGEISFAGLAPGDYKVLAFDRDTLDSLEFRNPEALAPYASKAATITLHAGEEATLSVERQGSGK